MKAAENALEQLSSGHRHLIATCKRGWAWGNALQGDWSPSDHLPTHLPKDASADCSVADLQRHTDSQSSLPRTSAWCDLAIAQLLCAEERSRANKGLQSS